MRARIKVEAAVQKHQLLDADKSVATVRTYKTGCVHRIACQSDLKNTRLNSSHQIITDAVFCMKTPTARQRVVAAQTNQRGVQSTSCQDILRIGTAKQI